MTYGFNEYCSFIKRNYSRCPRQTSEQIINARLCGFDQRLTATVRLVIGTYRSTRKVIELALEQYLHGIYALDPIERFLLPIRLGSCDYF